MSDKTPIYVLDSFALLAYFQAEAGGPAVRTLFEAARDSQATLHVSLINVGEMYYIVHREQGRERAEEMLRDFARSRLRWTWHRRRASLLRHGSKRNIHYRMPMPLP